MAGRQAGGMCRKRQRQALCVQYVCVVGRQQGSKPTSVQFWGLAGVVAGVKGGRCAVAVRERSNQPCPASAGRQASGVHVRQVCGRQRAGRQVKVRQVRHAGM